MAEKQSIKSALWPFKLLMFSALLNQALAQAGDQLDEMNYDWSTFLLLVIPVLIILVVLVLCVTGVFMFCLSTLTINYDQDYIGHLTQTQAVPQCRDFLPKPYLSDEKNCLNQTQSLPISEEVKLKEEELTEFDSISIKSEEDKEKERTDLSLELEVDLEKDEKASVPSKTGRAKQVEIEMEQNIEKDEDTVSNGITSKNISLSWVLPYKLDSSDMQNKYESPLLAVANFSTLQLLSLQYFEPQKELRSIDSVGVRG